MTVVSQLAVARNSLCTALNHYLAVCFSINESHAYGRLPEGILPELMTCVSNELVLIPDLEQTLLKARATLASTRNCAPCIAPISRLPDDILVRIFQMITVERRCNAHVDNGARSYQLLGYPRLLTHVCSRWREVALASKRLWLHVDIPSYISCKESTVARARECIARAGACPLDIHLVEPDIDTRPAPNPASLSHISRLLAPVSSQVQSLDFRLGKPLRSLQCPESSANRYSHLLSTAFKSSTPGSLTRLAISLENTLPGFTSQHYFMEASRSHTSQSGALQVPKGNITSISISENDLEALLLSVTTLELKGLYPRWASQAYHGLVELRLGTYSGVSIPETDLRAILSSSPGLRHLDFGLRITSSSPHLNDSPVFLGELGTLVTGQRSLEELGLLLRLIHPGSRPLRIRLDKSGRCSSHPDIPRVPFNSHIQTFFARAHVETLSVAGTYNYSQVAELLELVPRARVLLLNGLCLGNIKPNACAGFSSANLCLNDFYLLRGTTIAQHFLIWLIKSHRVRRLIVAEDSKIAPSDSLNVEDKPPFMDEALSLGFIFESIPSKECYPMEP
ncbi:unnamed protein product [Rhizoctonia solani]|uniref:F-box domain-containing protein n=1 Tax=Rhizoctonia solani TaxID=456999 RepID=A0A8H3B9R9_9AGAM|nr:unnamed protein product [Rhizoctonia solani]